MIERGTMTKAGYESVISKLNENEFKSNLRCFSDHKGLRRGEIHTVIGPKGGGKSTFIKTMIIEMLMNKKNVYCFLSEEKTDFYKMPIYRAFRNVTKCDEKSNSYLYKLSLETQYKLDKHMRNAKAFCNQLEIYVKELNLDCIVFDNFTTSFLGELDPNGQSAVIARFKEIAIKFDIPFVLVIHTAKGTDINRALIDGENVRGSATTVNMGSYNYIISAFFRVKPVRVFITIDKARYHKESNKAVYELYYDSELEIFTRDQKSNYEQITDIIKTLNHKPSKTRNF